MPNTDQEARNLMPLDGMVGAVMVVGAGISGIQAALDLANSGFKVYLVDKGPAIGGKMAQLDKTFPTNDCSMCIMSPKLIECSTNPNITIMTGALIEGIEGDAGDFTVSLLQEPRYVDETTCVGCGTCAKYCPVNILDLYNESLGTVKCIHIPFAQAVPAVAVVDPSSCLFTLRKICQICKLSCKNKAIDFKQVENRSQIQVGSLILAPGYEPFAPELQSQYGYKRLSNVVTSLEFERLLSASGPNMGELVRPSDDKTPKRIAWIQCVGSRDSAVGNNYCSAVCCMYAIKQLILSKDHHSDIEATVFHNDIRAYGKGFDRYYERAQNMSDVRFLWSKVNILGEDPETKDVLIRYRVNGNEVKDETFDLVVLSVGLTSTESSKELAECLSIQMNSYGFCESPSLSPIETSQPGIYACGVFHAPMDIPDSVTMASGAASLAAQLLSDQRATLIEEKAYPPERNVIGEPPKVGVFVCRCGTNIAKSVDVKEVVRYAEDLDSVFHAEEGLFICSVDAVGHIAEIIQDKGLNRVVVAACTPRTHEPLFQETLVEAGLNPSLFEFANIREHCSLVHMADRERATQKAQDIVRMAVSKAVLLEPLPRLSYDVNRAGLVIGGGVAGMVSALSLAEQGFQVHLVEKTERLGGIAGRIRYTADGADVKAYLKDLVRSVEENPLVRVYKKAQVIDFSGYVGNFTAKIGTSNGEDFEEVHHGVTIVATGAEEYRPTEYLYGKDSRVVTSLQLEERLEDNLEDLKDLKAVVMIQCVGSREDERPYCGRVCCTQSLKNALKLKQIKPDMDIYILFRDMRSYAFNEDYYREASKAGVKFIRYDLDDKPDIEATQEEGRDILRITVKDPTLDLRLMLDADLVVLAAGTVPASGNRPLSQQLKVPLNEDGFFMEAHMKLRPVDFATDGIFMCGLAHTPKFISESIAQAQAAASRAATLLSQERLAVSGTVAYADSMACSGCGVCVEICPYKASSFIGEGTFKGKVEVNPVLCKGCGLCVTSCRSGALNLSGFETGQIMAMINEV